MVKRSFEKAERSLVEGIQLSDVTFKALIEAGEQDGVPFDLTPLKIE